MDPNTNPGAPAPPQPQQDLGQTVYFPPVGQGQGAAPTAVPGNNGGGYAPGQDQPRTQGQEPIYTPPNGQQPGPNGQTYGQPGQPQSWQSSQPGQQVQPQYGQPWAWGAGHQDHNRALWGLILVGAGVLFLLDQLFAFNGFGSIVLLALGGGFMYAYYSTKSAGRGYGIGFLIPGSILLGLGVGTLVQDLDFLNFWGDSVVAFTLGLGFCLIWFLERKHWWALIPGGILVFAGLSTATVFGRFWPVLLIALGVYLLYEQSRRRAIH